MVPKQTGTETKVVWFYEIPLTKYPVCSPSFDRDGLGRVSTLPVVRHLLSFDSSLCLRYDPSTPRTIKDTLHPVLRRQLEKKKKLS